MLQKQMAEGDPQAQAEQMLKMSTAKIRKARCGNDCSLLVNLLIERSTRWMLKVSTAKARCAPL